MIPEAQAFYLEKQEPIRSCLLAMREIVLKESPYITEAWKYRMPFFILDGRMLCYLWTRKNDEMPYLGIVDGNLIDFPGLIQEKRSRMKILLVDPTRRYH